MTKKALFAAAALVWTSIAMAAPLFKSTMPDGSVVYGNAPVPGAKKVEKMTPSTQDSGVRAATPEQIKGIEERQTQRASEESRREAEIDQLKAALKDAEAAREAGREPKEGDFRPLAQGGTRLTEEFVERQKQLEINVQEARKRLDEAQSR